MHVALMGGSFNPPHIGHLLGAVFVKATRPVDEVWFMPVHRHPMDGSRSPRLSGRSRGMDGPWTPWRR
jgi:nicotinate-nucleotide adenylyltransferase